MHKDTRARFFELKKEMTEILEGAKSENRSLTEEESAKLTQYRSELTEVTAEMQIEAAQRMSEAYSASDNDNRRSAALRFAERMVAALGGEPVAVTNVRELNDRNSVAADTGLTIGDIIEPLEKGNILGMLGCKVQTGLVGDWKYPVVAAIEASIAGESAEVSDSKLTLDSVQPTPRRVSLAILVTKQALNATNDELRDIVLTQIVAGLDRLLNKWMFQKTAIANGVNGLFVSPGTSVTMAGAAPTYAEILALKAAVDTLGVKPDKTAAYVMTNAMRAVLESTPKTAGAAGMICEDDKINGVPVFVTEYAPAGCIEFGYFSYGLIGQFGQTDIIVDPYTKASSNCVRFILNAHFDIKAARPQAFGILNAHA